MAHYLTLDEIKEGWLLFIKENSPLTPVEEKKIVEILEKTHGFVMNSDKIPENDKGMYAEIWTSIVMMVYARIGHKPHFKERLFMLLPSADANYGEYVKLKEAVKERKLQQIDADAEFSSVQMEHLINLLNDEVQE